MEKYSQFRDRGSGISPFLPLPPSPSPIYSTLLHSVIFLFRMPFLLSALAIYFLFLTHLPLPAVTRKLLLWGILGIPGIWWVDLQLDGVKRGSLSQQPPSRVPHPRSVIAAQFTSPIDALYLAAVFDPIFTLSYPNSRKVQRIGLFHAITLALSPPALEPPPGAKLTTVSQLLRENPHRVLAVFPECSTTNGRGILPLSPSLLSAPKDVKIFPVSMRYSPQDITTPVPGVGQYVAFLWRLLSRPTHCIRVRIAEAASTAEKEGASTTISLGSPESGSEPITPEDQRVLDRIGEALARLARNKRVGLTLRDKAAFIAAWKKGGKR